jgi:hypothetical protein
MYRDHLKDVHHLSKDLLEKLNFKSGRFRSLNTLREKWKLAFIILFPEVPKDEIPSPFVDDLPSLFGIHNITKERSSPAPPNQVEFIDEDGAIGKVSPHLRVASLSARVHNWLFDRLSVSAKVPIEIKMDIIGNFAEVYESFVADLDAANSWKSMADGDNKAPLQDLNLDWSLLATSTPTPIFEFSDECTAEATNLDEPTLGIQKVDGDTDMDRHTFHGLPNSSFPATYPLFDSIYSDTTRDALLPSKASAWPSVNGDWLGSQRVQISASSATAHSAVDEEKATPSDRDDLLDDNDVANPSMDTCNAVFPPPSSNTMDATALGEDFDISGFFSCPEDEQHYYLNDSVGLDY